MIILVLNFNFIYLNTCSIIMYSLPWFIPIKNYRRKIALCVKCTFIAERSYQMHLSTEGSIYQLTTQFGFEFKSCYLCKLKKNTLEKTLKDFLSQNPTSLIHKRLPRGFLTKMISSCKNMNSINTFIQLFTKPVYKIF